MWGSLLKIKKHLGGQTPRERQRLGLLLAGAKDLSLRRIPDPQIQVQVEQEEQPKKQYECTICQDAVGGFDHRKCQGTIPYDCDECFDYYRDHRECQGMTRSEIVYEDYCRNYPSGREY
jgi:hypothetical protein